MFITGAPITENKGINMNDAEGIYVTELRKLTTPRAAAIAGFLFSILFTTSLLLLRTAIPESFTAGTEWVDTGSERISIALVLMPFAGIAFLWFIGVVRDQIGELEDKFFSTVFFGSGLLFLAMVFISMAIAGGIIAAYQINTGEILDSRIIYFARAVMLQLSNVYALRMAGVFMISLGTIWWRTGLMPRWLIVITYLIALILLIVINLSLWVTLLFPAWVFVIDLYVLYNNQRR
jgi:hypothetical protein